MRLRLNTTLRAALIAAVSTFALNTTASAASTGTATFSGGTISLKRGDEVFSGLYVKKDMTTGTASSNALTLDNAVNIWGGDLWAGDYTVSLWVSKDTLAENRLLFAYAGKTVTGNLGANGIYWDASANKITIGQGKVTDDYTNFSFSNNKVTSDVITLGDDNSMVNITFAVQNLNDGQSMTPTIWVNGVSAGTLNGYGGRMNGSNNPMNLYVGSGVTYGNVSITNETLTTQDQVLTLMGLSKTEPAAAIDYVWKGSESGVWDTKTTNWVTKTDGTTPTKYVASEDNTVTFDSTGEGTKVTLDMDTTIGSVTVDGAAYTLDLDGHTLTTGTLSVKNADASIALTGTGTVNASTISAQGKTINIDENVVLKGEGSGTLAGSGTYALASGKIDKGSIILGSNWTGTVRVTDYHPNAGANLSGLRTDSSTLELQGFYGWTTTWEGTNNYNIKLTNSGDGYAWNNRAFGGNTARHVMEFQGKWSGTGQFRVEGSSDRNMHYTYSGNITDWQGEFQHNGGQNTDLTFKGSATNVNIAISKGASSSGVFNVVAGTTGVTFNKSVTADKLTVQEGATATFNGTATFGSVTEAASAGITVGTTGNLTLNGGSLTAAITNNGGTVSLSGITLGNGFEENGGEDTYVAVDGTTTVTIEDNYYLGNAKGYVTVVKGTGTVSGSNITWNGGTYALQGDGTIITKEAKAADFSTFYLNKDSENISDILAHNTTAVQVNAGTLVVNQDATGVNITVTEFGAISGDYANAAQVGIASEALAQYTQDVEVSGVKFTPADVTDAVLIYNAGEQTKVYGTDDSNMSVSAKKLEMTKPDGDVTVSNAVYVDEIVNTTGNVLTLDNVTEVMELTNMNITGSTAEVGYITGEEPVFTEATVSISGVLRGGEATLLANLTLVGGSTLDVNGGDDKALTLGSMLTFDFTDSNGALVNLDDETIAALNQLEDGGKLNLIVAYTELDPLSYGGEYNGVSYDQLFSAAGLQGNYTVYAQGDAFGLTKQGAVPEPTTGTLSLLALAALAARRRRK